jgi:hypothetical protein
MNLVLSIYIEIVTGLNNHMDGKGDYCSTVTLKEWNKVMNCIISGGILATQRIDLWLKLHHPRSFVYFLYEACSKFVEDNKKS